MVARIQKLEKEIKNSGKKIIVMNDETAENFGKYHLFGRMFDFDCRKWKNYLRLSGTDEMILRDYEFVVALEAEIAADNTVLEDIKEFVQETEDLFECMHSDIIDKLNELKHEKGD